MLVGLHLRLLDNLGSNSYPEVHQPDKILVKRTCPDQ